MLQFMQSIVDFVKHFYQAIPIYTASRIQQYTMYPLPKLSSLSQLSGQQDIDDGSQYSVGLSELWRNWNTPKPTYNYQQIHSHNSHQHSHNSHQHSPQEQENQEDREQPPPSPNSEQLPPNGEQRYQINAKVEIIKSSIVRKIRKIILPHIKDYETNGQMNLRVLEVIKQFGHGQSFTGEKQQKGLRNSYFQLLFGGSCPKTRSRNLLVTRKILCRYLRKSIINSKRLQHENMIEYLNRIKCFALRCGSNRLTISKYI